MNFQENSSQNTGDFSFPDLFYSVLFAPKAAADKIQLLMQSRPSVVYAYGLLILAGALLSQASAKGNLSDLIWGLISWIFVSSLIGLFGWLLRPDSQNFDFGQVLVFMSFAQAPLVFLGITHLWEVSFLNISFFNALIHLWGLGMLSWAISSSLQVSRFKAGTLIAVMLLGPFLILFGLLMLVAMLLVFSAKSFNFMSLLS